VSHDDDLTTEKKVLERRAERARGSISATASEIQETIGSRVQNVKQTIAGVSDFRHQFAKEPVVWSLGTLAAGFALGYALGFGHRRIKGRRSKAARLGAFADAVAEELSTVGHNLVMPRLDENMKQLFGVEFSSLLADMKSSSKRPRRKTKATVTRRRITKRTKSTTQPRRG